MRKLISWSIITGILMIGVPWLTVKFAGSAGMAICFILFFGINPLYCAVSGVFAGRNIRQLWVLPMIAAGSFLVGTWMFFEMGEPAFLLYCGCYFVIGLLAMLISAFVHRGKS